MRFLGTLAMVLVVLMTAIQPVWAVDTTQTYQSGTLVLIFLGFCALIVVAQMVPALIMMMGTISGLAKKIAARKQATVAGSEQDHSE